MPEKIESITLRLHLFLFTAGLRCPLVDKQRTAGIAARGQNGPSGQSTSSRIETPTAGMADIRRGLIIVNTGPGKGKTTAAMGTALEPSARECGS